MAVSHIDPNQRDLGPRNTAIPGSPVQYFINPIGIQSIILSAIELGSSTALTTNSLGAFSANAVLSPQPASPSHINFPLVQGMGFVTGIYNNLMPAIQSSVFFRTVTQVASPCAGVYKYQVILEDSKSWIMYVTPGNGQDPGLRQVSNTQIQGLRGWFGTIQVTKNPYGDNGARIFDGSAGVFPTSATISGSAQSNIGTYQIQWVKGGLTSLRLLMYALPHHVQSLDAATSRGMTSMQLQTTTKGLATAVICDSWTMVEMALPTDMGFAPWTPTTKSQTSLSGAAISLIEQIVVPEINQDIDAQTSLDSMYFSGKALAKFATIISTAHDLLTNPNLALQGLSRLKGAVSRFTANKQKFPLVYDAVWQGVVSDGSYVTGDPLTDFGNTYYNDHHFHYGS